MKLFKYIAILFLSLSSAYVYAAKDTVMTINFINIGNSTFYASIENNGRFNLGPITDKNGGKSSMTPTVDDVIYPGAISAGGGVMLCQNQDGYLSLNPANYSGPVFITLSVDQNYHLQCSCTGTACTYSVAKK